MQRLRWILGKPRDLRDAGVSRALHNETAYSVPRRLQYDRLPMVILPTRVL